MFAGIEPHPEGLPPKRFNECVDSYLTSGHCNPDILPFTNWKQMMVLHEIHKSINRLKNKDL